MRLAHFPRRGGRKGSNPRDETPRSLRNPSQLVLMGKSRKGKRKNLGYWA